MTRCLFSFLMVLVLALTSQSMAVARGANAATGQMVLCTGSGPSAVYVDASGAPTSAPHICPDAALNVLFEVEALQINAPQQVLCFEAGCTLALPEPMAVRVLTPPSRAPPALI
ncbi:hypothetical protein [Sulfitobacter mediterraneus]|uniref:hypothetical protein n=1 Tax=Sulfitobacter mediterraneus TaxID=83219 RepID=UPI00216A93D1|nr:hypothetical protein [Sulfitobacter mediterraneus]